MKEVNLSLSSDNKHWVDMNVLSGYPNKVTIIDPRQYECTMVQILSSLQSVIDRDYPPSVIRDFAKQTVHSIMSAIVTRNRAWLHGADCGLIFHPMELKKVFGTELDPVLRDQIRYELDFDIDELTLQSLKLNNLDTMDKSKAAAVKLTHLLKNISEYMRSIMNPNAFTVHELTVSRNNRDLWLEEYNDWRVLQWTNHESNLIDKTQSNI